MVLQLVIVDAVYTVPAGAGSTALESIVIGITLVNKHTSGITASVFLDNEDGSNDVYIVKNVKSSNSSLEVMSGNKLVVQNDGSNVDVLRVESSRSSLDATITNFRRRIIEDKNGHIGTD